MTRLQLEALLTTARESGNFALVAMLGLLGLRTFEAVGADVNRDDHSLEDRANDNERP